jgi:predicted NUDIX family NTP pyrophosphohydrolase
MFPRMPIRRLSAGLLPFRRRDGDIEVFLVHPGGPFWKNKDDGAWSIAKGEYDESEDPLGAARREFREETGFDVTGEFRPLEPVTQRGGKTVIAWAVEADFDAGEMRSNTFSMEWPPKSGRMQEFPEVDRAAWFSLEDARRKILPGQLDLLRQLE